MKLAELLAEVEGVDDNGEYFVDNSDDEDALVDLARSLEKLLPREARYKAYEYNMATHTFWWVTQEAEDSQAVADKIAEIFDEEYFLGWTIHVILRDFWDGKFPQGSGLALMTDNPKLLAKIAARDKTSSKRLEGWKTARVPT